MITEELIDVKDEEKVAFEVEDINTRQNFVFQKEDDKVVCYNTSRDITEKTVKFEVTHGELSTSPDGIEPYDINTFFYSLYKKSLKDDTFFFIAWVKPL